MSESFTVVAEARADEGKGASRRLRRLEGKVPGVVYGGESAARSISLIRKDSPADEPVIVDARHRASDVHSG